MLRHALHQEPIFRIFSFYPLKMAQEAPQETGLYKPLAAHRVINSLLYIVAGRLSSMLPLLLATFYLLFFSYLLEHQYRQPPRARVSNTGKPEVGKSLRLQSPTQVWSQNFRTQVIHINSNIYNELVMAEKPNITFMGDDMDKTLILSIRCNTDGHNTQDTTIVSKCIPHC
jgi:hypothetical protein